MGVRWIYYGYLFIKIVMTHINSVFANSCLKVPVDPISKMPKTAYERTSKLTNEQSSIDSLSTCSIHAADVEANKLKDFYRSIPDYNEIHHLTSEEFYSTLKSLREKKKIMFGVAIEHIDDCNGSFNKLGHSDDLAQCNDNKRNSYIPKRKVSLEANELGGVGVKTNFSKKDLLTNRGATCLKQSSRKKGIGHDKKELDDLKFPSLQGTLEKTKQDRPKRNHSACSISWNDAKIEGTDEVDKKFDKYFDDKKYTTPLKNNVCDMDCKTQSVPTSPVKVRQSASPTRRRKSITVPKPFKMTERDEEDHIVNELRCLQKSFSEDMLNLKCNRKKFRARPVPIESRIPLYDKILEDQAMRRAVTKMNSEAELRAQMKPFSFTKREEKGMGGLCDRAALVLPKSKKKKRFRARPVPKNLFSNYIYNRMKEDEFFRSINKRIRAEEMLRNAHYPGNMAARDRSRLSTPAAHSDLPIDPSPAVPSISSSDRQRCVSPTKERKKRDKHYKDDLITTSPQPFRFNTADRAAKKMENVAKKMYQESKSSESLRDGGDCVGARAYSALELRGSNATGRSNLAALLRAEAVRRRFEMDAARRLAEQRRRVEMKHRDRLLRSKPSWHLVKNNHEEDIAIRLQTRRDEERMRREEFLHEMELMYGRVQQQPMLFERYYAPRPCSVATDTLQLSPRKTKKRSKTKSYHYNSPSRSRKVSINDNVESYSDDVAEYLNRIDLDDKYTDSDLIESLERAKL